jgi:hypothetical protein
MRIHLVKSAEVSVELFTKVMDLLQAHPGPLNFSCNLDSVSNIYLYEKILTKIKTKEEFEKQLATENNLSDRLVSRKISFPFEREEVSWDTLFSKCNKYRRKNNIKENEFVIMLTDIANNKNWFACLDESNSFNGFIHTADWQYFISCSAAFPIAYEVIALVLQKHMFDGMIDLRTAVHNSPIGCVNDLCIHKKEIILKLRTADVCNECMRLLQNKITMPKIHHALTIMNSLREKMLYAQNFRQSTPPSRLLIDAQKRFLLTDFGNIEIKLRPLEKALYILFLKYPKGIYHSSLSEHRTELYEIYSQIANMGDLNEMKERIDDMVNALSDSASQKMSRIKRVLEEAIGTELAKYYFIKGEPGKVKSIALDRNLLKIE